MDSVCIGFTSSASGTRQRLIQALRTGERASIGGTLRAAMDYQITGRGTVSRRDITAAAKYFIPAHYLNRRRFVGGCRRASLASPGTNLGCWGVGWGARRYGERMILRKDFLLTTLLVNTSDDEFGPKFDRSARAKHDFLLPT